VSAPTLGVVVPATDAPATLDRCLAAIAAADDAPAEVVVVRESALPGPAAARNEGAARVRADVLVFVDADVLPHADSFTRIREALAREGVDAVFGSYDDAPLAPGVVSVFRNLLHHHVHQQAAGEASTFWAGLGAVRRDAFEAAGGFDAVRFPHASIEDVELGTRLVRDGRRVVLDPGLQGTHLKRWTLAEMVRVDAMRRAYPWAELLLETGGPTVLNLGPRHRASALAAVAGLAGVVLRRPRLAMAGTVVLVALNARFYALLLRRRGPLEAAAGVGLHAVHHVAGLAGAAAAVARRAASRGSA
jgi:GT2 family glycosyltransferase